MPDDPRDADPTWWPICEDCDEDATVLRRYDGAWWFYCPTHERLLDTPISRVREGLRPKVEDASWGAAWAAIQGVPKLDDEEVAMWRLVIEETGWRRV